MNPLLQANQGRKILHDWLGENGVPVPLEEAQSRANVCIRCPHNYKGSWLWNMATSIAIGSQMRLREVMDIHLENESELEVCDLCGCKLKLKVHTPFKHIYQHTSDQMFERYPQFCWQKIEYNQIKSQTQ